MSAFFLGRLVGATLLLATLGGAAVAGPKVRVVLDRKEVQLGQPVQITLHVQSMAAPKVQPPKVNGASLTALESDDTRPVTPQATTTPRVGGSLAELVTQIQNTTNNAELRKLMQDGGLLKDYENSLKALNQTQAGEHVVRYLLQPERVGTLAVPGFTISADGQTTTTPTIALQVYGAKPQELVKVKLSLADPAPLVGEETQLFVDVLVPRTPVTVNGKDFPGLPFKDAHFTLPTLEGQKAFELSRPLEQLVKDAAVPAGSRGCRVNQYATQIFLEADPQATGDWYRRRLTIPIKLREAGRVELAAVRVGGEVFTPTTGPNKTTTVGFVAASEPLRFEVHDFRSRGDVPQDFHGAIGSFQLSTRVSQTNLAVGTPFTLTVRLEGEGSLARATAPALADRPEFNRPFRVRLDGERTEGKAREFVYTLRPLSEDVEEVPPVSYVAYNAAESRFEKLVTPSIPLHVTPAPPGQSDEPVTKQEPAPAESAQDVAPSLPFPLHLALWPVGVGCFGIVLWRMRHIRPMGPVPSKPRKTPNAVRSGWDQPLSVADIRREFGDYLRERFALTEGELTPIEVEEGLLAAGATESLARQCGHFLEICAAAEFGLGTSAGSPPELARHFSNLKTEIASQPLRQLTGR